MTRHGTYDRSLTGRPVTLFGKWLLENMVRRGLNQAMLAAHMGVSRQQINTMLYEPMIKIQMRTCVDLASALDVRLVDVADALGLTIPPRDQT